MWRVINALNVIKNLETSWMIRSTLFVRTESERSTMMPPAVFRPQSPARHTQHAEVVFVCLMHLQFHFWVMRHFHLL